jgi:hypothetical protein
MSVTTSDLIVEPFEPARDHDVADAKGFVASSFPPAPGARPYVEPPVSIEILP